MEDEARSAQLTDWAVSRGAKVRGIRAHQFPGKGLGIIAERRLEAGQTILEIPISLIRTEYSLPKRIKTLMTTGDLQGSVNGLLALELAFDTSTIYSMWRSTLPSLADTKSMPLFWPPTLHSLLPLPSLALLKKQQSKLLRDWSSISPLYPSLTLEQYTHAWLLISTRTFYYTPPNLPAEDTPIPDECLAIVPFGDYFNHDAGTSPSTLKVNYSPSCYEFITTAPIAKGEELFISYGSHSNDFLLVEYGFILPLEENEHDGVALDAVILPLFSKEQRKMLNGAEYLGNYVLDRQVGDARGSDVVCYRTIVALRLLCMPLRKWKRGLKSGFDDEDGFQGEVMALVRKVLVTYTELAEQKLKEIAKIKDGSPFQRDVLTRRWEQIRAHLSAAMDRVKD